MNLRNIILPNSQPPAFLTVIVLITIIFIFITDEFVDINKYCTLSPSSLWDLDLTRLLLYPLAHLSIPHLLFNCFALFTPLNAFEATHGTVYTFIMLNILSVVTGVIYCVVGHWLYPTVAIAGASGWCFTLFAYFSVRESTVKPTTTLFFANITIPTILDPVVTLVVIALLIPGSSFWGHLFGLLVGYLMGWKEIIFRMVVIPSWIITYFESKLKFFINLTPRFLKYYLNEDIQVNEDYVSIWENVVTLPITNNPNQPTFQGTGNVLGTA
ncbi:hypothetical protein TPHA_0H01940 [Tetrapisispora phaffii CBS 4417]|uniref:Rhomboid-type serine protease 2 n=1 Tax=Tetrapisispora phaffii (strain ATCC 24235 / CBS 4417 / NBRC 1672 / NRRL Y-8282 / UCD 70-5) TaxID=1071381 RepID=G8BWE8_TETPH|nr:hypothetical protein TPHA_0H01940 [Tetrapisispora phaffii CBS 4417]CCE64399.1 hypothetical protein TPHA_0H01940 [Tetrapisispora phaffii CBS 4417]